MDERKIKSPETDLLMQAMLRLNTAEDGYVRVLDRLEQDGLLPADEADQGRE